MIDEAITLLVEENALSESRFAELYLIQRVAKGYGSARISQELEQRGVGGELYAEALAATEIDWQSEIFKVYRKKYGSGMPETWQQKGKCGQFLRYRGFSSSQIEHLFSSLDTGL